ncbi:uncharacterized protein LOC132755449 [Ruditapes philippinarum]|uniref:uncharacterized protein LOC132755449 n=1 Tax=Ruditapes philippinarum TaxID=129788 RepID=UPI00295B0DFD|nr:uncharacterized protein LOC132755449 [Ruditapes philippinarum]
MDWLSSRYILYILIVANTESQSHFEKFQPTFYQSVLDETDNDFGQESNVFDRLDEDENSRQTTGFISLNVDPYVETQMYGPENLPDFFRSNNGYLTSDMKGKRNENHFMNGDYRPISNSKRLYVEMFPDTQPISRHKMRLFPYRNVVKISSGCTGTLVTPIHVLTAAHCVHDGLDFKDNMEMLKVEVTDRIGYRVHYIVKINVPVMWLKTQTLPEIGRGAFDYAILHLNLPVNGLNKFMQLSLPTVKTLNSDLDFLGFKSNSLWLASCNADENILFMRGNIVLRKCKTSAGNSGAAIFSNSVIDGSRIVGILSNTVTTAAGQFSEEETNYEAIMLLTLPKCLDICAMTHPEGDKFNDCESIRRNNQHYVQLGSKRIKPFFG